MLYGLGHHIPNKLNCNSIHTEFKQFEQLPKCERYSKIHVPYKYQTITDSLSKNQSICIVKQNKGRGFVVMVRSKYTERCLNILPT